VITQQMVISDAQKEFAGQEHEQEKVTLANRAVQIGLEWMQVQAKSESPNMTRGEKRRLRRQQRAALRQHIEDGLKVNDNAVVCIIPAFILLIIFESIVSWAVWQLLNKYFAPN